MRIASAFFLTILLGVTGFSTAADDKDKEKEELKAIAGAWVVEKAEMDGADITAALKMYVLKLEGNTYVLEDNGVKDKGTLKVDGSKTPKHMDIVGGPESPFKGKTFPCIYEVKDGKLIVCYGMDFKTRPTEFKTMKDSKRMLATYAMKK